MARIYRVGYCRANRSVGVSTGRGVLHDGACRLRGVGLRCVVILCASVRQNPGRSRRIWGRSRSIVRSCVSTYSITSGTSITDGITKLLVPECFPCVWGLPLAEHAKRRHGMRRRGRDSPQRSSSVRRIMTHSVKKEKLIVFMVGRKKSNRPRARLIGYKGSAMAVTWVAGASGYLEGLCGSISFLSWQPGS
jgi:hypothetical protein